MKLFNRWPIKIFLFNERAKGGITTQMARARRFTSKTGEIKYEIKGGGTIPPVLYDYITNDNYLFLYRDQAESYAPMEINSPKTKNDENDDNNKNNDNKIEFSDGVHPVEIEPAKITGIDINVKNWIISSLKRGFKLWQEPGLWAQYSHFIMSIAALIGVGVMIYISLEKIIELQSVGANAAAQIAKACQAGGAQAAGSW